MARYVPSTTPVTEDITQLERYLREETAQLQLSTDDIYLLAGVVLDKYSVAGYGNLRGAEQALPNINANWQTIPFDSTGLSTARGVTSDPATSSLIFEEYGVWRMSVSIALEFTEANQGRRMALRLRDLDGVPGGIGLPFSIGRNTDGENLLLTELVDIGEDQLGDRYVVEINSSADTFASVVMVSSAWDVNLTSEYRGDSLLDIKQ